MTTVTAPPAAGVVVLRVPPRTALALLVSEMAEHDLPEIRRVDFKDDGETILLTLANQVAQSVWAHHFGGDVTEHVSTSASYIVWRTVVRWNGYRLHVTAEADLFPAWITCRVAVAA